MLNHLLTEAAQRALDAATLLAARNAAPSREPEHLLWALSLIESHASEILREAGLTRETLARLTPLASLPTDPELDAITAERLENTDSSPAMPESDSFRRIIAAAVQSAAARGRGTQVSTEHLLEGLLTHDSRAADVLRSSGLSRDTLPTAEARSEGGGSPLEIDFDIRWRERNQEDRTHLLRIIDASANRAREGLRVLEDYARFALDDAHLTRRLKESRHALQAALGRLDSPALLRARETQADVGTSISTLSEICRQRPIDIAIAAFKRVQEALRSLEEFAKLWSAIAARDLERLRYQIYTLEKSLLITESSLQRLAGRRLYLLATESLCHHGSGPAVRGAVARGVGIVQVREKELSDRRLADHARHVIRWAREAGGALVIINDRADLAVAVNADGVHVGQDELGVKEARTIVGPDRLIGVSTHTIDQARQAVLDGADYIGVGPVFSSSTKAFDEFAGLELVRQVAAEITLPWFAIGGITADNIEQVLAAGGTRIAVSAAICSAPDPESAARTLCEKLMEPR